MRKILYYFPCGCIFDSDRIRRKTGSAVICPKHGGKFYKRTVACTVCGEHFEVQKNSGAPPKKCKKCKDLVTVEELAEVLCLTAEDIYQKIDDYILLPKIHEEDRIFFSRNQKIRLIRENTLGNNLQNNNYGEKIQPGCNKWNCRFRTECLLTKHFYKHKKGCDQYVAYRD